MTTQVMDRKTLDQQTSIGIRISGLRKKLEEIELKLSSYNLPSQLRDQLEKDKEDVNRRLIRNQDNCQHPRTEKDHDALICTNCGRILRVY